MLPRLHAAALDQRRAFIAAYLASLSASPSTSSNWALRPNASRPDT